MLLAAPLIDLPAAYRLMSAMPTGLNAMVVSHAYGLDNQIVAEAITWSTAIVVAAALVSPGVLMLHHVGIEIRPADVDRAVEFFALLGFEPVEPPPALAAGSPGSNARAPRSTSCTRSTRPCPRAPTSPWSRRISRRPSPACTSTASRPVRGREHWGAPRAHAVAPGGHRVELMSRPPGSRA